MVKTLAQIAAAIESDGEANTSDVFMADVLIILNTPQLCCGDVHETDLRLKHAISGRNATTSLYKYVSMINI